MRILWELQVGAIFPCGKRYTLDVHDVTSTATFWYRGEPVLPQQEVGTHVSVDFWSRAGNRQDDILDVRAEYLHT